MLGQRPLRRGEAVGCAMINQFATPGLGSIVARHFIAGTGQLILAVIGFCFLTRWIFQWSHSLVAEVMQTQKVPPSGFLLHWGIAIFGIAWLWSLITSIQILMAFPRNSTSRIPPRIV